MLFVDGINLIKYNELTEKNKQLPNYIISWFFGFFFFFLGGGGVVCLFLLLLFVSDECS